MGEDNPFQDLIRRVRVGDDAAATQLVRRYEPHIRRIVRVRLVDARLKRLIDSMDICQSVMASFFVRAALGQYQLNSPEQLLHLLATMAKNKLINQANHQRADCRDYRRIDVSLPYLEALGPSPSRQIEARDLLQKIRDALSQEEKELADLRGQGLEWQEIAARHGGQPDALRKRLARAIDRVADQLGLDG